MLKHGTRQVYRLHSPWLSSFPDLEVFLNKTLTVDSLFSLFPSLDLSSFPDSTAPLDIYLNPHLPSHSDRLSLSQLPNSASWGDPLNLKFESSFAFRFMVPSTSLPQQQWSQLASGYTALEFNMDLNHMQVRSIKITNLNVRSENPEVAIRDSLTSADDIPDKVVDLKVLADGL
jgi:hypothetical protein